jgi:hypothetical protein
MAIAKGSVLHVSNFLCASGPRDKFVFVLGHTAPDSILVFTISSQTKYQSHPRLAREMVHIPPGSLAALKLDSWIQCFWHPITLVISSSVGLRGTLAPSFLVEVRKVIDASDVLNRIQIADCLDVIDRQDQAIVPPTDM